MKKSASSSTVKLREAEMTAALQLIQLTGDSCSSGDGVESSVQGSMKNMEEESTRVPANAKKKTKFRSISSLYLQNENNADSDSKLSLRDEKDQNYYLKQGVPRSMKFRSFSDLYKCTNRLSPVEDEYNWNRPARKDSNMNISAKEDSSIRTNKNNVGCKRKRRENQKGKGKKDVTTSSTSKIAKVCPNLCFTMPERLDPISTTDLWIEGSSTPYLLAHLDLHNSHIMICGSTLVMVSYSIST